ncbi:ATP-dependent 6-phosphofructokinase [bacterium]|nr:ATP-dependent 6-phosphofructokinase [bacterium]
MKIAICTGGGDAPGLNAVIRAAVLSCLELGWDVFGIRDGMRGLLRPEEYPNQGIIRLDRSSVRGITHLGGTFLGTSNRDDPTHFPTIHPDGSVTYADITADVAATFAKLGFDALISVGGDGSMKIASRLSDHGLKVVGVPKTIDNDLDGTVATFGFDTAVQFACDCIDRLHSTAASHQRVMVVEVMGRYAGWIALESGLAGTADVILLPEIPYALDKVVAKLQDRHKIGARFSLVVVAEGAFPADGQVSVKERPVDGNEKLGGAAEKLCHSIRAITDFDTRHVVLGHLLRGGAPSAQDRNLSLRFGAAAVRALAEGRHGVMVALAPPEVRYVPLSQIAGRMKKVPLDCDTVLTCRALGVCLGD